MSRGDPPPSHRSGRRASPRETLLQHGIRPSRLRGQSFLLQPGIATRIVGEADLLPETSVIEIGPGLGILTRALAPRCRKVLAIEIDARLVKILGGEGSLPANVEVLHADALKVDYARLAKRLGGPVVVVANLPYAISTPLLFRFLEARKAIQRWVLMLQREVGERILAPAGTKTYGALSVPMQLYTDVRRIFSVGPANFYPRPKVGSVVVRFDLRSASAVRLADPDLLEQVVRAAFGQRRKTLANALASLAPMSGPDPFAEADIDPRVRGERLQPEEFARLANAFHAAGVRARTKTARRRQSAKPSGKSR